MIHTVLGRTGLQVSVVGLGCGGHSRLGQTRGASEAQSVAVVKHALDAGVDFIDTAWAYGTEEIVGKAIAGRRDEVVISTKGIPWRGDGPVSAEGIVESLEESLHRLATDRIDVYHLHGVAPEHYDHCASELVPALLEQKKLGKLRFLGITERFGTDTAHAMLPRALDDDCWDVVMVGFSLLNPSARPLLARCAEQGVGTLIMFAVRQALSNREKLREVVAGLVASGEVPEGSLDATDPLGFLVTEYGARSVVEAAYRFCRHEPGADVVLTGTGSVDHLDENLASLAGAPLPDAALERLELAFGRVDSIAGN